MRVQELYKKTFRTADEARKDYEEGLCSKVYEDMLTDLKTAFRNGRLTAEWRDWSDNRIPDVAIACAMGRFNQQYGVNAKKGKLVKQYTESYVPVIISYNPKQ